MKTILKKLQEILSNPDAYIEMMSDTCSGSDGFSVDISNDLGEHWEVMVFDESLEGAINKAHALYTGPQSKPHKS